MGNMTDSNVGGQVTHSGVGFVCVCVGRRAGAAIETHYESGWRLYVWNVILIQQTSSPPVEALCIFPT